MNKQKLSNPSNMILSQVTNTLKSLDPSLRIAQTPEEVFAALYDHLRIFYLSLGQPTLKIKKMVGPPISQHLNNMLFQIFSDLNVIFDDYRSIGRYIEMAFDLSVSEHLRLKHNMKQIGNLLSDYRMYSRRESAVDFVIGDTFTDKSKVDGITSSDILTDEGVVVLKRGETVNRIPGAIIKITDESNGLIGNYPEAFIDGNQETKYETTPTVYEEQRPSNIKFFAEINPHDKILETLDDNPDSWMEYHKIIPVDTQPSGIGKALPGSPTFSNKKILEITKGLGFTANLIQAEIKDGKTSEIQKVPVRIDGEPSGGVLKLHIFLTLPDQADINWVSLSPFVPHFVQGYNYTIKDVLTSVDGVNFVSIAKKVQNIFSSGQNESSSTYQKSISIGDSGGEQNKFNAGSGVFTFSSRPARYVLIEIEQDKYYPTKYGHIYYVKHTTITTTTETKKKRLFGGTKTSTNVATQKFEERVEGPLPDFTQVTSQENGKGSLGGAVAGAAIGAKIGSAVGPIGTLLGGIIGGIAGFLGGKTTVQTTQDVKSQVTSGVEEFSAARWLIGIRDISIQSFTYVDKSEFVSTNFKLPKDISKISLIVNESVPEELLEKGSNWIEYYFSLDGGREWIRISPQNFGASFDESGNQIPELFNAGSDLPDEQRISSHGYVDVNSKVIKFKAVFKRSDNPFITPVLRDYRFKIISQSDEV